jgi:hypothetical protein
VSTEQFDNIDPASDAVVIRQMPRGGSSNNHALALQQKATSGRGQGLNVMSDNPDAPAAVIKGAGDLLDLRNASGSSVFTVTNAGAMSAPSAGVIALDTTDASTAGTAINAAISALPANGGTILIPAGTWTLDTAVLISKSGVVLQGVSPNATLLRFDGSTVTTAVKMADTTQRYVTIRDLRIESSSDGNGTAIDASYFVNSVIQHVRIGSSTVTTKKGIVFNALGSYYNVVRDCRIHVSGTGSQGLVFDNTSNSNTVDNVRILGDTNTVGVYVNSHAIELNRIDIENGCSVAIDVAASGHDCTILSPYIEAAATGLRMASNVESTTMVGGVIIDCTTANITDNGARGPHIFNTRVQYDPYTSIKALNVPAFTINSVPVPANTYQASDLSLKAWNYDPAATSNSTLTTNGTVYLAQITLRYAQTISNLLVGVSTAATSPTANQSFLGLYDSTGALVASTAAGAIDTALASSGLLTGTVQTPYAAAAGTYWVAFLNNAGTAATLARASGSSLTIANAGAAAASLRFAVNGTGRTTLASPITPGSNTATGAFTMWAAVS